MYLIHSYVVIFNKFVKHMRIYCTLQNLHAQTLFVFVVLCQEKNFAVEIN